MAQQPPRQIVQIVGAFAQDRIAQPRHAQPHIILHTLDGGFGGEAGVDRVAHPLTPALVIGKQPISLDHLAAFAREIELAGIEHQIDGVAKRADGLFQPHKLGRRILGDHLLDLHARLMQHHAAHRDTFRQSFAVKHKRPVDAQFRFVEFGDVEQSALRHNFGQNHGNGLQRFDFLFGIKARGLVLHREDAEHLPAAHNRHAEERLERIFTGFRAVGEMRIGRRVAEVDRLARFGGKAHKPLAILQPRAMHGFGVQTLGREQFEHIAGAPQIDRTDFRDHVGRDHAHQLVEARLGAGALRHDLAQAAQKNARTTGGDGRHQ